MCYTTKKCLTESMFQAARLHPGPLHKQTAGASAHLRFGTMVHPACKITTHLHPVGTVLATIGCDTLGWRTEKAARVPGRAIAKQHFL